MVVKNTNVHNIMGGMESTGGVRLHNHRRKLKQRFDIIRKLGQGTYGKVQLGINKETGQEVAIKTIKKAKIETEADLIRIRREIQIMSSVQHPNIIHIYEVFENREKMVLVMEYAAGGELYDYLSERKVLSQDEARRIFRQIATAVFYCHKHKICHRDLKLENILLDEHGSAKIADFGLSNVFDEQRLLNTFCGSPLYASPEIVKGTPYHGPEVDCWSLGVLLYTLVYGAMPFDGSNFKRLVKQISQGDYFEPKKPSPASSLIRDMLTVSPARRADIEKVCSHWWVNEGYNDSCLQIAEELADQTPVRLDLLLSLAPPPAGVGTDNIMQQGLNNTPCVPHAMVPTRCHSVGSLMELDHTATEQLPQRVLGAIGQQSLYEDNEVNSAQSMTSAASGHGDSTKRKLEEGASSSDVNLRGAVKRDRGKRKSCEESVDANMSLGRTKLSSDKESQDKATPKLDQEEEKMDTEEISDSPISGVTHLPESMGSSIVSKDSGVETLDDVVNSSGEVEPMCKSSTVSSTATIIPAEDFTSSVLSSPDDQVPKESPLSDINSNKNKKSVKKKQDAGNDLKMSEDSPKDLEKSQSQVSEKKDSGLLKEPQKSNDTKQKQKKNFSTETNDMGKGSKISAAKNIDNENVIGKNSKTAECPANSIEHTNVSPKDEDGKENEIFKTSAKSAKSKGDLVLENLNTETPFISSASEPSTPPATTIERRRSKIFETADKFNNILSGSPEAKGAARDKPKKIFIPGVKVSDFKKAFERKLSSPEISVSSFSKKSSTKLDDLPPEKSEKTLSSENNFTAMQKMSGPGNGSVDNNSKIKTAGTAEDDQLHDNLKGKKTKSTGNNSMQLVSDEGKKENILDSNKSKLIKTPTDVKKTSQTVTSSKSLDSAPESTQFPDDIKDIVNPSPDTKAKPEISKIQEISSSEKIGQQTETAIKTSDERNEVIPKTSSKPSDTAVKKKSSKVEITLKSATLPRRKTSKAEIKLDPAIPPLEFKTEIEHMINAPTVLPTPTRQLENEQADNVPQFRSWSLEPESSHLGKMSSRECIIPIQIEREGRENANLTSPPVGRPPVHPFQQRSMSQSQRSSTLSRQSTQESDSELMEPIRKSPREYIIPIAVEGGGYVTPRAGSLEPSASDDSKSKPRSVASSSRSNHYRRMSSLLSDTSEDEGFNMSPVGLQRHGSINRGRDDSRTFHFHRLRSSRPMRHSLEHNDSLSSAEEDDDDDDDEGFEILTAESLFSTLLSRVRSLTQRLTVEDGKRPGFPSNHFVNQLTNISHPSTSFKNFYGRNKEPLSRRLSETSSFPRLLNRGGDFGSMHQRSLSRDSSNCDSVNSEGSCSIGTFPRGSTIQKFSPTENIRRGTRNSTSLYQYGSGFAKGGGWQTKPSDEPYYNNPYQISESSARKVSSNGKNECRSPSYCRQSHSCNSPWKLSRTLSLRSPSENKGLCNSPLEENTFNKYSVGHIHDRQSQNIDLPVDKISSLPVTRKREKLKSPARQNAISLSRDFKSQDYLSGHIVPSLSQGPLLENKCNSIPRPFHTFNRMQGQERGNKRLWGKNSAVTDCYQQHPKHSSSLPSIVEGPKNNKHTEKTGNSNLQHNQSELHKTFNNAGSGSNTPNKQLNNTENLESSFIYNNGQCSENVLPTEYEMKLLENNCDKDEATKSKQPISSQNKISEFPTSRSQSRSPKSEKCSLIPKSSSTLKQEKGSINVSECTDKDDVQAVQKRRISRFLRPDFFDTPPEESTYVKEREAKKAAEAEIKKAKRLARRTSSMRETQMPKIETQSNSNPSEYSMTVNKHCSNKSINSPKIKTNSNANLENHNERKSNSKRSTSLLSLSEDKNNQKHLWSSSQKGDCSGTTGTGLCATAKSRIGKAISSLQEHNFTPWDKKVIATESTYLKRAVSVDDVSLKIQGSLSKSNPKLGRKISSVLSLFSKLDSPAFENQHPQNVLQSQIEGSTDRNSYDKTFALNEQKLSSNTTSLEKAENKLEGNKTSLGANVITNEENNEIKVEKHFKSPKDSKPKQEVRRNKKKIAAQVISDAISITKEPQNKMSLKSNSTDLKSENVLPQKVQQHQIITTLSSTQDQNTKSLPSNLQQLSDHVDGVSDIPKYDTNNTMPIVNETCEKNSIAPLKENSPPNAHNLGNIPKFSNVNSENSPADETESAGSWCACSDTDAHENLISLPGDDDDDDDDKESESVEDRIRRKSFYSRFNDVKKKGRKKSSQFLKESRPSLLPIHHKNNENQSFLSQAGTSGVKNKRPPFTTTAAELQDTLGDTSNGPSLNCSQHSLFDTYKSNEISESNIKDISFPNENRTWNSSTTEANETPVNTCALLRPAAFAQGVLKKTPLVKAKVGLPTLPKEESTSIPKPLEPVLTSTAAVVADENCSKKGSAT